MTSEQSFPSIADHIQRHARRQGDAPALSYGDLSLNYEQLLEQSSRVARWVEATYPEAKTIAVCLDSPLSMSIVFVAARLLDITVQVLNAAWPSASYYACVQFLRPDIEIDDKALVSILNSDNQLPIRGEIKRCNFDPFAAFYTGFTSGSEGVPKGFTRHEQSWLISFSVDELSYRLTSDDTVVCPGSLAHSFFLYSVVRALYAGAQVLFLDGVEQRQSRLQLRNTHNAVLFAVPAQLQHLEDRDGEYPHTRSLISAGAKLSPSLRERLTKTLPNAQILECYGSSELSYIALSRPADNPPPESVGKTCSGVEVRILDSDDQALPPTETGKIYVRSSMQFMGYAEPNNQYRLGNMHSIDGFLNSGDTGYVDDDGFLYITGRSDRAMSIAGRLIFAEQIEAVLALHSAVRYVAALPLSNPLRGQRPVAVMKLTQETSVSRRELMQFAAEFLPDFAVPRHYYVCSDWPRTVSNKTDFPELQARLNNANLESLR